MTKKIILTKKELEKLIKDADPSIKFVQNKKTSKSSKCWNYFHHIVVNDDRQQFVSCNNCKGLFLYSSLNGTSGLRTHISSCQKQEKSSFTHQRTVHDYYTTLKPSSIPTKLKFSVGEACAEFCALDCRAFDVLKGEGFKNLVRVIFEAGRSTIKSSIDISDLLPHPTTVRIVKYCDQLIVSFYLIFFRSAKMLLVFMMITRIS